MEKARAHFKSFTSSIFVGTFLLFLLVNGLAFYWFTKYKDNVHDDLAAAALQKSSTSPDVVFAGSSTVLFPLWFLDSSIYGAQPDTYERVHYAEDALKRELKKSVQVNNVSFLGFMISDDLFVVKNYLKGDKAPKSLVLMVAPRDFCDSMFESPASGIAFRKLANWSDTVEFCGTYLTQPSEYIDFIIGKSIFTYSIRAKIQDKLHDLAHSRLETVLAKYGSPAKKSNKWEQSIKEYTTRYKTISDEKMDRQFVFLNRLLNVCKERNIDVVLVNAPLTEKSLELLPPNLYQTYCAKLASVAKSHSCHYFDLSNSKEFSDDEFNDIVHLNATGAERLMSIILPTVAKSISPTSVSAASAAVPY